LDCVIRRVFTSSKGEDCMLLCPVDTPVQILKSTNIDGWSAVSFILNESFFMCFFKTAHLLM
jgi:hypothetical protein